MYKKRNTIILLAIIVVVIGGSAVLYKVLSPRFAPDIEIAEATDTQSDAPKQLAPDFTVYDAGGNAVALSELQGKPVVLNFWASWCPPCKAEMPEFNEVFLDMGDDVQFMMVDLVDGGRETAEIGAAYIEEQGFSFPVYFDSDQDAAYNYGVRSIPTTLFIDAEGYVVAGAQGAISKEHLLSGIEMITAQQGA